MKKITGSASKIVFLLISLTVCIAYLYSVIRGIIQLDSKDFFALALMVFTFYFANKGETAGSMVSQNTTTTSTSEAIPPMAGK